MNWPSLGETILHFSCSWLQCKGKEKGRMMTAFPCCRHHSKGRWTGMDPLIYVKPLRVFTPNRSESFCQSQDRVFQGMVFGLPSPGFVFIWSSQRKILRLQGMTAIVCKGNSYSDSNSSCIFSMAPTCSRSCMLIGVYAVGFLRR